MSAYLRPSLVPLIDATPEQTTWDIPKMRAAGEALMAEIRPILGRSKREVSELIGPDGQSIELRTFLPGRSDEGEEIEPEMVILSIHGGGYVAGHAWHDDTKNAQMSGYFQAEVISPEYRLAPEFPYPAGWDDCEAALDYAIGRAHELGRPLYVFGDSAGGGLAYYSVLRKVRAASEAGSEFTDVDAVILLEPCIDPRAGTDSYRTYADGPVWTIEAAYAAREIIAPDPRDQARAVAHIQSTGLMEGYPPTIVIVNPVDPLRDEGISLATHLVDAGVRTELHMYAGTFHGSLSVRAHPVWREIRELMRRFFGDVAWDES